MSEIKLNINPAQELDWLIEAATEVATSSESDFTAMQSKKWYKRLWETITFSKDNQIRTAKGVSSLAKLQDILTRVIVTLSKDDATISEAVKQNSQLIRKLSANDRLLQKKINKIIYGGRDEIVFSDLPKEKQIILANLLAMADRDAEKNDESRRYMNAVLSTAGISGVDDSWDYSVIESLSLKEQELLYRLILTNRHLLQIDPNKGSKILDYIAISSIRRNEIWGSIQETAQIVSPDFFASLYENTNDDYELLDDCDIDFDVLCLTDDIEKVIISTEDFEEITISDVTHIQPGQCQVFRHKIIHICANVECDGKLEFDTCLIHYGQNQQPSQITLNTGSSLVITNSSIICHSYSKSPFIDCDNQTVVIEQSTLENCCSFIKSRYGKVTLRDCKVQNPGPNLINADHGALNRCSFVFENTPEFIPKGKKYGHNTVINCSELFVNECIAMGEFYVETGNEPYQLLHNEETKWYTNTFISSSNANVTHCTFEGIIKCLSVTGAICSCVFSNCMHPISKRSLDVDMLKISDCRFDDCTGSMSFEASTKIEHSQFNNWIGRLADGGLHGGIHWDSCDFNNWKEHLGDQKETGCSFPRFGMLDFVRFAKDTESNSVSKCTFNGMKADSHFIIHSHSIENLHGYKVTDIKECIFKNCYTNRSSVALVNERDIYFNAFKKEKEQTVAWVYGCQGLENVNKTGWDAEPYETKVCDRSNDTLGCSHSVLRCSGVKFTISEQ